MRRHIVFDHITVAGDVAHEVGLVPPLIKIAVPDLSVVIGAHRVVALTDVHHDMHVLGEPLDGEIDGIDRRADLVVSCHREIRFVDLNVLAARFRKASQVLAQQLAEIAYHSRGVVVIFVMSDHRQKMRPCHGDLHRFACKGRDGFEFVDEPQIDIVRYRPSANRRRMEDIDVSP